MKTLRQELKIIEKDNKILVYTPEELLYLEGTKLVKRWIIKSLICAAIVTGILLIVLNFFL